MNNESKNIDKVTAYIKTDLNTLKNKIKTDKKIEESYHKVIKQRQSARRINTKPELWGNKAIMNNEKFLQESKKLNIKEITNKTSVYEAVFILLQKL
ncbi:MAG: hypothetical protein GXP45_05395 [bacterium]|nr:hypothetical protein [bacterium]